MSKIKKIFALTEDNGDFLLWASQWLRMPGDGCYTICSLFTKVAKPGKQSVTSFNSTWLPSGSHELAPLL